MHEKDLSAVRHSLAHLLAAAVMELYPDAKRTIGPAIDNGFYFDFEFSKAISDADLPKIEKKMREILPTWDRFTEHLLTADEAKKEYPHNPYKHELIDTFSEQGAKKISFYKSGGYWDLCRGGHVESMKTVKPDSFKLDKVAGAYWHGDEKNAMLQRIYGLAFASKKDLNEYLSMRAEAEKRDHKKLGPQLEIFMFHETSLGMPYWLPKGVIIYNELIRFWRDEHRARGYQEIVSPMLNKKELYMTSGHYEHYWPDMFVAKTEEGEYGIKAMNCPNAMVVFGSKLRIYRDLPLRLSDTDSLHRYERSGTLNGLFRVREFRQDDAHIFIDEKDIFDEYKRIFEIVDRFYAVFGLPYRFRLGTRPESFLGDMATWDKAESTLTQILQESEKEYLILEGDGAFYGPKVDILMKDALGREWQMGTIQLDFQQPQRFQLEYAAADGTRKTPVVIHRVIYGSLERFMGIIIEHFAGAFPLWLSPVQVAVLPVGENFSAYAAKVFHELNAAGIRAEMNDPNESLGKRIREAETMKIPYILVVGEKEESGDSVAVRSRKSSDSGKAATDKKESETVPLAEFLERIKREIKEKAL
jgi:threonyl-tRNA synthetase